MSIEFEKVPFSEYRTARQRMKDCPDDETLKEEYKHIQLPKRDKKSSNSAEYIFLAPFTVSLTGLNSIWKGNLLSLESLQIKIPTGIKIVGDTKGWFLMCLPDENLGMNYGLYLWNTANTIDTDYRTDEGSNQIYCKISSIYNVYIVKGRAMMRGILLPYLKTDKDMQDED